MFELTISTSKQKVKDINFIISKLRPCLKQIKGILVCEEIDGRVKLALAVHESKKDMFLGAIFDIIAEAIVISYKEEYLQNNISMKNLNEVTNAVFIKALVMFDKDNEKDIVKNKLTASGEIVIDSFYLFRLWDLEKKWSDLCRVIKDNSSYLQIEGTLFEMLRFLIMSNNILFGELHLHKGEKTIYAHGKDGKEVFSVSYREKDNGSKIGVISELLSLSPEKIIIHNDIVDNELSSYIESLFDGRVRVLK